MIPLTTVQGLAPEILRDRVAERPVFIWGGGDVGLDVLIGLRRAGFNVQAFIHTQAPAGDEDTVFGLPRLPVSAVLENTSSLNPFVVIASVEYRLQAASACAKAGLIKGRDYIDQLDVRRPVAVLELVAPDGRCMPYAAFTVLLDKLLADQPLLCHLELAWLGDPGVHPELARCVAYAERFVPCTVSTFLHTLADAGGLLEAGPSRLNLLVRGYGAAYETVFGAGSWERAQSVLGLLKRCLAQRAPAGRVLLRFLRTAGETPRHLDAWRAETGGSDLRLNSEWPYVTPYDFVLTHCQTGAVPERAAVQFATLPWVLGEALALAASERGLPCLSQRVFPVIGVDGAVAACHLYRDAPLADDYLRADWAALLAARSNCAPCLRCQTHALHRLDVDVLLRRHPEQREALLGNGAGGARG